MKLRSKVLNPAIMYHLKVNDMIIEVRNEDGMALKLTKARNPVRALGEVYKIERYLSCILISQNA